MKKLIHIGLMVDASRAYGRGICHGVADYAARRPDWVIIPHERPEMDELPATLAKSRLDGIIAYIPNRKLFRKISALGVPVVDVHGRCKGPVFPVIESDSDAIARVATDFFLRSSFRHLAYCGYPGVFFSDQRAAAFARLTRESGIAAHIRSTPAKQTLGEDLFQYERGALDYEDDLVDWLKSLPKPVAILACNDIRGQQVVNACNEAGIRVPDEVAVLGVDNDEIICRLCRPPLSSIEPDVREVGELAGRLMDDMLGGKIVATDHRVPPLRVVERASTDVIAAEDPLVLGVIRKIREKACEPGGVSVEQLCEDCGVSRSTLDKRFLAHLGRSVSDEIARHRLHHGRQLLLAGGMTLDEVATGSGFSSATYFCRFFKRETGGTPDSFRRKNR